MRWRAGFLDSLFRGYDQAVPSSHSLFIYIGHYRFLSNSISSLAHSLPYLLEFMCAVWWISCLLVSPLYEDQQHLLSTCRTGACPVVFSQPLRVEQSRARYGEVQEEDLPIPYLTDDAEELGPCPAGEQHTQRKT